MDSLKQLIDELDFYLECFAGGLILCLDYNDNTLSFLHETIQEYLTAEFILKYPEYLNEVVSQNSDKWGMIFAYAIELNPDPDDEFIKQVWRINPLFIALTIPKENLSNYEIPKSVEPFYYDIIEYLLEKPRSYLINNNYWTLPNKFKGENLLVSDYFFYMKSQDNYTQYCFYLLKDDLIKRYPSLIARLIKDKFLNKYDINKNIKHKLVKYIFKYNRFNLIPMLINHDIIVKEDYKNELHKVVINTGKNDKLLSLWLAGKEVFNDKIAKWIENADINDVAKLLSLELANKEVFKDKIAKLIESADIKDALRLVALGLAVKEDFKDKIAKWIKSANIKNAEKLLYLGLADKEDFKDKTAKWIKSANIKNAEKLLSLGLANKEGFKDKIEKWIAIANPKEAEILLSSGLANKEDFTDIIDQWIANADIKNANKLLSLGLANKEDFTDIIDQWIANADIKNANKLLSLGLADKEDFKDKIEKWIANASPKVKRKLISSGLAQNEDFEEKNEELISDTTKIKDIDLLPYGIDNKSNLREYNMLTENDQQTKLKIYNKLMGLISSYRNNSNILQDKINKVIEIENLSQFKLWKINDEDVKIFKEIQSLISKITDKSLYQEHAKLISDYTHLFSNRHNYLQEFKKFSDFYLQSKGVYLSSAHSQTIKNKQTEKSVIVNSVKSDIDKSNTNKNKYLESFVRKEFEKYYIKDVILNITDNILRFEIFTDVPGLIIGKNGSRIEPVKEKIKENFKYSFVYCKVIDIHNPDKSKKTPITTSTRKKTNVSIAKPVSRSEELQKLQGISSIVKDYTNFSNSSRHIRIYIDESWPSCQSENKSNTEGVIAGIIWLGNKIDNNLLRVVKTHKKGDPSTLISLLKCSNAMPFIMPLKAIDTIAMKSYLELIESAVKIILGWLLPQSGTDCLVDIFPEHFTGFDDETEKTEHFQGMIKQANIQNPIRYKRFKINLVQWQSKDFEYIPYADILAYLALEHNERSITSGSAINYKNLYGYVPLSLELFHFLSRLDQIEKTESVSDLFYLIDNLANTQIYKLVTSDLLERLVNNESIKLKILKELENRYYEKERNIEKLRKYFYELKDFISDLEENSRTPVKLLFKLLKLRKANHDGNPAEVDFTFQEYDDIKKKAIELREFDIVTECDLNLAVHFNDSFDFQKAYEIMNHNLKTNHFDFLKYEYQAKIYSSIGQILSILNRYTEAEEYFLKALEKFSKSEDRYLEKNIEQTNIYRLFNSSKFNDELTDQLFNLICNKFISDLNDNKLTQDIKNQYIQHIFLKIIYSNQAYSKYLEQYLAITDNSSIYSFHPWELIAFYRGLIIYETDTKKSYDCLLQALEICKINDHGDTINLIGAIIATTGMLMFENNSLVFVQNAEEMLINCQNIQGANEIVETIKSIISSPDDYDIDDVLTLLPFNYI